MRIINSGREGLLGRGLTWDLVIEKRSLVQNFIVNMDLIYRICNKIKWMKMINRGREGLLGVLLGI